jgi:hypothetical protein
MGYLNKATVTVDAILTKKGRELLAKGRSAFEITKFAVSDDEIDYGLFDPAHPLGSEYYGSAIENMPLVEAVPDETQNLRYKLVTLDRNGTNVIPRVQIDRSSIELTFIEGGTARSEIVPSTSPVGFNELPFGYTAILYDREAASLESDGLPGTPTVPVFIGDSVSENAIVKVGTRFTLVANRVDEITNTQLVIIGNETGASVTIPVTIFPATSV